MFDPSTSRGCALVCASLALSLTACVGPGDSPDGDDARADGVLAAARLVPLYSFWNASLGDNALSSRATLDRPGYARVRTEGNIFRPDAPQPPGTRALYTWYSATRGDYFSTTNTAWAATVPGTTREGYAFVRLEGYVFDQPVAGTAALQLWWSPGRADNHATTDPAWGSSTPATRGPDYQFVGALGHVVTLAPETSPVERTAFHQGDRVPAGVERPVVALLGSYRDHPMRHSISEVDALYFGPAFPNVRDYAWEMSGATFRWARGGVVGFSFPDDPDTHADEATWSASQDVSSGVIAYAMFSLPAVAPAAPLQIACNGGGGAAMSLSAGADASETLGLDDTNGGSIEPGDTLRLKCFGGQFVASNGTRLVANGTPSTASRFVVERASGSGTVASGTSVRLRLPGGSYVAADLSLSPTASGAASFTLSKVGPDVSRLVRDGARAVAGAFNFGAFDTNGDGIVQAEELTFSVVVAGPASPPYVGAATRGVVDVTLPGSRLLLRPGQVVAGGEDVSITTIEHELTHTLGAYDLYGASALNTRVTLMGATIEPNADDRSVYHLDPWHKLWFGWVTPRVVSTTGNGGAARLDAPQAGGATRTDEKRPLLVYDPARYDVGARSGEYFLIEHRDGRAGGYDREVSASGVVIWQLSTDSTGVPRIIASLTAPGGIDRAANTFAAPNGTRGGTTAWTAADGVITPRYIDGSAASFRVRVAPRGTVGSVWVEWSPTGTLTPRLDSAPSAVTRGRSIDLSGLFPVFTAASAVALVDAGGVRHSLSVAAWAGNAIRATVPTSAPLGPARLVVTHAATTSNAVDVVVR